MSLDRWADGGAGGRFGGGVAAAALPPLCCFFLQLCSPLFPLFPLSTLFFLLCSGFVEVLVAAACGRKMTVTGKSNNSSCLLLLPRAEEQVVPFLQMVQRRVGGR